MSDLEQLTTQELEREFFNTFILGNGTRDLVLREEVGVALELSQEQYDLFWHFFHQHVFPVDTIRPLFSQRPLSGGVEELKEFLTSVRASNAVGGDNRIYCVHGCKIPHGVNYLRYQYPRPGGGINFCYPCFAVGLWVGRYAKAVR